MFKKVLIANRGEIAIRIIRTLREMNIGSVSVYSQADHSSLHVRLADESVCIGPAMARESYLSIPAIIAAAKITGADAIHPGYGFLSENADFSAACRDNGITFIGPSPKSIQQLGHKAEARKMAVKAGIPVTPGTKDCVYKDAAAQAAKIGYPIMIKAAAGGGGKGIRIVRAAGQLANEMNIAQSESKAAFGNGDVYFEKYIELPRHIEVQFARDSHGNVIAFPERDCSIQRRHQKLVEESPSPAVDKKLRASLEEAAVKLAEAANYVGVGTVEFLLTQTGEFYFMEVNTRLQVEHPVTEYITGFDLVKEQFLAAAGEKLSYTGGHTVPHQGHCIEHRINAEDFTRNFAPSVGRVEEWILPGGPGIRIDTHVYSGYNLPVYYDSMLAKLIVWGPDRASAVARSRRALEDFKVKGIKTTIEAHKLIVESAGFQAGKTDTGFMERLLAPAEPVKA
ncbi:MAG: acetyl-CoA carboxylase biotin carboxylase subunit [Elusimicrobia bacterium RIFOXYA2_FULL_58_8]|nr:MAG: acetyl-CoA carboxylase biotin carboxylase subunit [Elusimicrobia bacterium RIFOXYA12_FULL_57_11]OGS17087.1 MAG: acetyl-CoA carboxylase biotin carboxylase subunit [Elusimicrobia bacterium RIFOXYA2_FULL_58_8]